MFDGCCVQTGYVTIIIYYDLAEDLRFANGLVLRHLRPTGEKQAASVDCQRLAR